jgi:beta-phosphoglucomutase
MSQVKAILFDFDGVLGKTMEDNCRAWQYAFSSVNLSFDAENFYLAEGKKASEFVSSVLHMQGRIDLVVESIVALKNTHYEQHAQFSLYEPAEELIASLRDQGIKVGVVSGGSRGRLLGGPSSKLLSSLDVVITGDDLSAGKPSPECYIVAAHHVATEPEFCVVIENAPLGIKAAKAAGMRCIAICSTLPAYHLREADHIIASLSDLPAYLESCGYANLPMLSCDSSRNS